MLVSRYFICPRNGGHSNWLLGRQAWIEKSLARRHLEGATLLLYDVSSSYLEGRCSPLAAFGHNRDGKQGKQQIVFGLLCAADGCPVAVDVFAGNTADPSTVGVQVKKVQQRFGLESIALVGDRGLLTTAGRVGGRRDRRDPLVEEAGQDQRGGAAGRPAAPVSDGRQADAAAGEGIRLAWGRSEQICCQ